MKTIRWGIVGCGDVTEVKSGPGFQKASPSSLVAVMRRDAAKARDYAFRHGVPRWYDSATSLIQDPEVDAVYVATPPSSHREYVLQAAQAGKPVYVEKPLALNAAEGAQMVEACRRAGVPLFVAYYRRCLPRFARIKALLDEGAIGEVRVVTVTQTQPPTDDERAGRLGWRVDPAIAGGGKFVDVGSHTLDILDFLLGPVESAVGRCSNQAGLYRAEDTVTALFTFASGVQGTGLWSFAAHASADTNRLVGTRGEIEFSTFGSEPTVLRGEEGTFTFDDQAGQPIQQPLIQSVVNALNGEGSCPSTGESGLRTTRVMDQILKR